MAINEPHASHIRSVYVGFVISGKNLNPDEVTQKIGLSPDAVAHRGDLRKHSPVLEDEGWWCLETKGKIDSKDINDHLHWLLARLLPVSDAISQLAQEGEAFFDVLWQSTYLYAGTGPVIERDCLRGIAQLHAGMGFDIYQIDEDE